VIVIGEKRGRDRVAVEEDPGDAGVLAGDEIGGGERLQSPQRNIAEVADRSGDNVEAGLQRPRRQPLTFDREPAPAVFDRRLPPSAATLSGRLTICEI